MIDGRIVFRDRFDDKGYTDENSLHAAHLTKPDTISAVITHLGGKESDKFPLTFLTEGQKGGGEYIEVQDAQYMWDVMRREVKSDVIVRCDYVSGDTPGMNGSTFVAWFRTRWLVEQHPVVSPNGYKARIAAAPQLIGNMYRYELEVISGSDQYFIPVSELQVGVKWGMIGNGLVSESDSMGNRSNIHTPGKMKNQLTFMRKSYSYSGNVANRYVEIHLVTEGGKKTMKWMDFEEYRHQMMFREQTEEWLWESIYNRNANGVIALKDRDSGKVIPVGAGVYEQIPNQDTYGILTYEKLNQVLGDAAYGATDTDKMQFVLYGGKGFLRDFDEAIKAKAGTFTQITGDKFTKGEGRNLVLTGFYKQFEHVDGHTVIVKWLPILDFGGRAEVAPKHPITGFPMTSHEAYFVDQSMYDGQRNLKMVTQKGRSLLKGVLKGMAPLNDKFGYADPQTGAGWIATERDSNSVHYFTSKSVSIMRPDHCVALKCVLS